MKIYYLSLLFLSLLIAAGCAPATVETQPESTDEMSTSSISSIPPSCPVTKQLDPPFTPPGNVGDGFEEKFWFGSNDLYLALPNDGTWPQLSKGEKVFWWGEWYPGGHNEPHPDLRIHARLLDDPEINFEQSGATNAAHSSFPAEAMLIGLEVPSSGCWEITGEYRDKTLSFVVWIP